MFLTLTMSLIPNNIIWNTLIPSRPELPDDINDFDDNENEEDDARNSLHIQVEYHMRDKFATPILYGIDKI